MELSTESMTAYGIRRRIRTFATIIPWRTCLGKPAARRSQKEVGLPQQSVPLLSVIARLTSQKGIDLIVALLPELIELDLQLVVLGTGDQVYERTLTEWAERYPKIAFRQAFDEGLAHRIEAGADLFLMPSRYEPCGLGQLYSLRYGTVPIVRKTGGLADTVCNYAPLAARVSLRPDINIDSSSGVTVGEHHVGFGRSIETKQNGEDCDCWHAAGTKLAAVGC
ncbi:MAG: glycosyltransferase [Nitrospiraceae bacterium]